MALTMLGESYGVHKRSDRGFQITLRKGRRYCVKRARRERIAYNGRIWCPQVADTATWVARRNGRVFITHNTDVSDSWEREGEDPEYFYRFSPDAYAVGINIMLYAMTH